MVTNQKEGSTPVKLPNDLIEELDKIKENSQLCFKSRPEILKYLIRKYLDEHHGTDNSDE